MESGQKPVLLLVEDNLDDIKFLRLAFSKRGLSFRVEVAHNGEQAVEYLEGRGAYQDRGRYPVPTHVILDLKLPKKSGIEVLQWMKERPNLAGIPVAIFSSSGQSGDENRARDIGVDHYWVKPTSFKKLLEIVDVIARWMTMVRNV